MELNESQNEALDVEGLLAFAENALINAGSVWSSATVSVKQDVQWAFFPQGLRFDGVGFGTVGTCLPFDDLQGSESGESRVASPTGTDTYPRSIAA